MQLSRCDVVVSLAAICNPSQYNTKALDVIESNFIQARKIADLCAGLGKWLIQFSTSEVYGQTLAHWTGTRTGRIGKAGPPSTKWTRRKPRCYWVPCPASDGATPAPSNCWNGTSTRCIRKRAWNSR